MNRILFIFWISTLTVIAQPAPFLRNPFTTNAAGTPVIGNDNISITNSGGSNWLFHGNLPRTVTTKNDVTNTIFVLLSLAGTDYSNFIRQTGLDLTNLVAGTSNTLRSDYVSKDTTTSNGSVQFTMSASNALDGKITTASNANVSFTRQTGLDNTNLTAGTSNTLRSDYVSKDTTTSNGIIAIVVTNVANSSTDMIAGMVGLVKTNTAQERVVKTLTGSGTVTLTDQGTNVNVNGAAGSAAAGGASGMIQWNNGSVIDGTTNLGWDKVTGTLQPSNTLGTNATFFSLTSSNVSATNISVRAGGSLSNAIVGGTMFVFASTADYTNCCANIATLTNLGSFTIPGNTLTNNGDRVDFAFSGVIRRAQAATNNLRLVYGATTIMDTGVQLSSNGTWRISGTITRIANAAQYVQATLIWDVSNVAWKQTNAVLFSAENNGIANTLQLSGGSRTVATITNNFISANFLPAYRP